jgi:hypothetical protein
MKVIKIKMEKKYYRMLLIILEVYLQMMMDHTNLVKIVM